VTAAERRQRIRRNWLRGLLEALPGRRPCPVCGGQALPAAASWMHSHLRCRRCDLIFVARLPRQEDLIAAYQRVHLGTYQVRHKEDWEPWMRHKHATLEALGLADHERGGPGIALDLGCGEGRLLKVLELRGWRAEGLEPNASLAAEARVLGQRVTVGALESFSPARPVQLITMCHLIEHLRRPLAALDRVRGWLAPPALLLVETPLSPDYDNIDHLYCFSAAALARALTRSRFSPLAWFDYVDDNYHHHNLACLARRV